MQRAQIELPYTTEEVKYYQRRYPRLDIRLESKREILRGKIRIARALDGRIDRPDLIEEYRRSQR